VSQPEIAFLALGIVLGAAAGAALVQIVRGASASGRSVRVTIAPNAIPVRGVSTLAVAGGVLAEWPVPDTFDDNAWPGYRQTVKVPLAEAAPAAPAEGPRIRTSVPFAGGFIPAGAIGIPIEASASRSGIALAGWRTAGAPIGVLAAAGGAGARPAATGGGGSSGGSGLSPGGSGLPPGDAGLSPGGSGGAAQTPAGTPGEECSDERRLVAERCAVAEAARTEALRVQEALRDSQRAYDALRERVERAQEVSDPRQVALAKERLHAAFRSSSSGSPSADEAEAAARAWLAEINGLNAAVREAKRLAGAGEKELATMLLPLERLSLDAAAARISAENAAAGCLGAREELARCEERIAALAAAAIAPEAPPEPHPFADVWPTVEPDLTAPESGRESVLEGLSAIVRVLNGDREARDRIVATLAAGDSDAERDWQLRLAHLVDAIVARAIEDGFLDMPEDDPFWRLFGIRETREIVVALAALGFRYDGLGGFADERVPGARDLSLAVGYAGLDPMRIRAWPREAELTGLYAHATVAADEWLAAAGGDLSLGRMVDALGSRAGDLAEVWNAWGRVRPALLAT
jgi:hypothetical protein